MISYHNLMVILLIIAAILVLGPFVLSFADTYPKTALGFQGLFLICIPIFFPDPITLLITAIVLVGLACAAIVYALCSFGRIFSKVSDSFWKFLSRVL